MLFGAGKSATVLIDYLAKESRENGWKFIIADADKQQILAKIHGLGFVEAVQLDIKDDEARGKLIERAHIVISMMPPALHFLIAKDCVEYRVHLLTASYLDPQIRSLRDEINHKKLFFLCEMGLDPGIDHMSAMQILDELRSKGATIHSFQSHCGGLVAPESDDNPWHYKVSWNPRNIVLAGKAGAIYKKDGAIISERYEDLFQAYRTVATGNVEMPVFSYYPNRDSLPYIDLYQLQEAETFVRTTLRHTDFMLGWKNLVELQLTNEEPQYETDGKTLSSVFTEHLSRHGFDTWLQKNLSGRVEETKTLLQNLVDVIEAQEKAASTGNAIPDNFMLVTEDGDLRDIQVEQLKSDAAGSMAVKLHEANLIMKQLMFLGMDDNETLVNKGLCSPADLLQFALEKKLALSPGDKDLVVMLHEIDYSMEEKKQSIHSSLIVKGDDHLHTAMAKTVGLPLGIAAKLILTGELSMTGLHIPVSKAIYEPVLKELAKHGISFVETRK